MKLTQHRGGFAGLAFLLIQLFSFPETLNAAIAYGADAQAWTYAAPGAAAMNLTFSAAAGTNRILFVALQSDAGLTATASYGGSSMTLLRYDAANGNFLNLYYVAAVPAGVQTLSVVPQVSYFTGPVRIAIFSYSGVDQTIPFGAQNATTGSPAGPNYSLSAAITPMLASSLILELSSLNSTACPTNTFSVVNGSARFYQQGPLVNNFSLGLGDWAPGTTAPSNFDHNYNAAAICGGEMVVMAIEMVPSGLLTATPTATCTPSPTATRTPVGTVLFVAGANPIVDAGDLWMKARLETVFNLSVVVVSATVAVSGDAVGKDLVLISASVTSNDVGSKFLASAVPVWTNEDNLQDNMSFTGVTVTSDYGLSAVTLTAINVVGSTHYVAGGLSGSVAFLSVSSTVGWGGSLSAGADIIAVENGVPSHKVIYAYENGVPMTYGYIAPARRLFFGAIQGALPNLLSPDGYGLFDRSIQWLLGASPPTPTPSVTRTNTATPSSSPTPTWSPTATPSNSPTPTWSPTATPSSSPTISPSNSPSPTATRTPVGTVLFVAGANPIADAGDLWMKARLESVFNLSVVVVSATVAVSGDATGKDLVLISASGLSSDVGSKFLASAVPVWTNEDNIQDNMSFTGVTMTTDYGQSAATLTAINVVGSTHYVAGGLSGSVAFLSVNSTVGWGGSLSAGAEIIAVENGVPSHKVIYVYESGVPMAYGYIAPARRLFFGAIQGAFPNLLSPNGYGLFDRGIQWLLGASPPTPTPSVTRTHTPTWSPTATPSSSPTPTWSPTATPSNSPTPTWSPTATPSSSPTRTWSPTATPSSSPTPTWSPTATPSNSPTPTWSPTGTPSSSPTRTWSPTATPSNSPTPTWSPTTTPSSSPTPTWSPTATQSSSPTPTASPTVTPSNSPTWTGTASPTATPTSTPTATLSASQTASATPTPSPTPSATSSASPTVSPTSTATPSATATATATWSSSATPSGTATQSPSPTPTVTATPSISETHTISPTPGTPTPVAQFRVTIRIIDTNGAVLRSFSAPASDHAILNPASSAQVFNPFKESLSVSDGNWNISFDGKDNQGHNLPNGIFRMEIKSDNGSGPQTAMLAFSVLGQAQPISSAILAPNPALKGQDFLLISWMPSQPAEVWIYDAAGSLVKSFASGPLPPLRWDLRTVSGAFAANGVYLVAIRVPGERNSRVFKLALAR